MTEPRTVRFAVVGVGWFAQTAILPGFKSMRNAELAALVSGDPAKHNEIGERYGVPVYGYGQYDDLLKNGAIDAVYLALPPSMHKAYTVTAARHKVHVLCERPMAVTPDECRAMVAACDDAGVKLMVADHAHFEAANRAAVEYLRAGAVGEPRVFDSVLTKPVRGVSVQLAAELAGGPVRAVGIDCVNAARRLFGTDPVRVTATAAGDGEAPELVTATLRFPKARLATFTCGFAETGTSEYRVVGTTGDLHASPAYGFGAGTELELTTGARTTRVKYRGRDHAGAEIAYFADCVRSDRAPEPDGCEGLADLLVVEAIDESARTGKPVWLRSKARWHRATPSGCRG